MASYGLKTPTAVAEFLLEKILSFEFLLSSYQDRLSSLVGRLVGQRRTHLERLAVDLGHLSGGYVERHRFKNERLAEKLTHLFLNFIHRRKERLDHSQSQMGRGLLTFLKRQEEKLNHMENKSELINPRNVLKRGYSMTLMDGKVVDGIGGIKPDFTLETRLYNGTVFSKVEKTKRTNDKRED